MNTVLSERQLILHSLKSKQFGENTDHDWYYINREKISKKTIRESRCNDRICVTNCMSVIQCFKGSIREIASSSEM
jgi:hypothetical protein